MRSRRVHHASEWGAFSQVVALGPGAQTYSTRYVHKISPKESDTGPDVTLRGTLSKSSLAKALRAKRILSAGESVREFRKESDGRIVVFPPSRSIWWSIILTPKG